MRMQEELINHSGRRRSIKTSL